jgi:hypothetical protein
MNPSNVKSLFPALLSLLLFPALLAAQTSSMLQVQTIQATPGGPLQFTFRDDGTGATNYIAEFSPVIGADATWTGDPAAIITLIGEGEFEVLISDPTGPDGFYRVVGLGGTAGEIIINFVTTAFQVLEGGMISPTITFSAPFTGTIRYTIGGSAAVGDYAALSGELQVNHSTTATIPVTLIDNEAIGELKNLTLTLEAAAGTRLGANSQTIITIDDNDARWEGSFVSGEASLPFALEIARSGASVEGALMGDASSFFPSDLVPATVTLTASAFTASITGISMPENATLLNLPSVLELDLSATNGVENQEVGDNFLQGHGVLRTIYPGHSHLNSTTTGSFLMHRLSVRPSTTEVELVAAP